MPLVVY